MMKPTSLLPNSQSRPSDCEQPRITVDQFLNNLSIQEKEILAKYLVLEGDDQVTPLLLRQIHGDVVYKIAYAVQELIGAYGSNYDSIRGVLLSRLSSPPHSGAQESVRQSLQEVINPFVATAISTNPPPNEEIAEDSKGMKTPTGTQKDIVSAVRLRSKMTVLPWADEEDRQMLKKVCDFLDELSDQQIMALVDLVNLKKLDDRVEVRRLIAKHGPIILELNYFLEEMSDQLVCPLTHLKQLVAVRLNGSNILENELPSEFGIDSQK